MEISRILGFTGTREGMTPAQIIAVDGLTMYDFHTVHHGDCVGADAMMHAIARANGQWIVGHPPSDPKLRAYCTFDEMWPEKAYYTRNRDIVNSSGVLLATPKEMEEQPKGGTWYTVGYARTKKKPIIIVWPNGDFKKEGFE